MYEGDHKEFIDQEHHEPLYKQIQDIPDTNANHNHKHEIHNSKKTKTFREDNSNNTIRLTKDEIKLSTLHNINNLNDVSLHNHKHPHNPVHVHNKHHDHAKEELVGTNKNGDANIVVTNNELNVDKFVLNETENGDNLDQNIDEDKHTTRPRVNTFDHSKLPINQMRKHLNGVLIQENQQQLKKKKKNKHKKSHDLDANCAHDNSHNNDSDSDIEEATLKNVVSSKGKFLSLLQARNICNLLFFVKQSVKKIIHFY